MDERRSDKRMKEPSRLYCLTARSRAVRLSSSCSLPSSLLPLILSWIGGRKPLKLSLRGFFFFFVGKFSPLAENEFALFPSSSSCCDHVSCPHPSGFPSSLKQKHLYSCHIRNRGISSLHPFIPSSLRPFISSPLPFIHPCASKLIWLCSFHNLQSKRNLVKKGVVSPVRSVPSHIPRPPYVLSTDPDATPDRYLV